MGGSLSVTGVYCTVYSYCVLYSVQLLCTVQCTATVYCAVYSYCVSQLASSFGVSSFTEPSQPPGCRLQTHDHLIPPQTNTPNCPHNPLTKTLPFSVQGPLQSCCHLTLSPQSHWIGDTPPTTVSDLLSCLWRVCFQRGLPRQGFTSW